MPQVRRKALDPTTLPATSSYRPESQGRRGMEFEVGGEAIPRWRAVLHKAGSSRGRGRRRRGVAIRRRGGVCMAFPLGAVDARLAARVLRPADKRRRRCRMFF